MPGPKRSPGSKRKPQSIARFILIPWILVMSLVVIGVVLYSLNRKGDKKTAQNRKPTPQRPWTTRSTETPGKPTAKPVVEEPEPAETPDRSPQSTAASPEPEPEKPRPQPPPPTPPENPPPVVRTTPPPKPAVSPPAKIAKRQTRTLPPPADLASDVTIQWNSVLGPGGAIVPRVARESTKDSTEGLTHVEGIVFTEGPSPDIMFIGHREPRIEPLSRDDLLDAFVLAYRALAADAAPGVSIDPLPQQLDAGLTEGALMNVVYFGDTDRTLLGQVAFEADRVMKCLSLGRDNITGKNMVCNVKGYQTELALAFQSNAPANQSWHRFWIEFGNSPVERSKDGRAFRVFPKLVAKTEYMKPGGGKLVPANLPADPAAQKFVDHLTSNYDGYAREFPVFARLQALAALVSVAAAIQNDDANAELREIIEERWPLFDRKPREIDTATKTPAIVVSGAVPVSVNSAAVLQLSGGVKLKPEAAAPKVQPRAEKMEEAVLVARGRTPNDARWSATIDRGQRVQILPTRLQQPARQWQQDLAAGPLRLVREYGPRHTFGQQQPEWFFRVPRLSLSDEIVEYNTAGKVPRSAVVLDDNGRLQQLPNFGLNALPGQGAVKSYFSADQRTALYQYANQWVLQDGGASSRLITFSPDESDGHRVLSVQDQSGTASYSYRDGKLQAIRHSKGEALNLSYDSQGRIAALQTSGARLAYHYDDTGRLRHIIDGKGQSLGYSYREGKDEPIGVRSEMRSPVQDQTAAQYVVEHYDPAFSPAADPQTAFLLIEPASNGFQVSVQGLANSKYPPLPLSYRPTPAEVADVVNKLLRNGPLAGVNAVLLTGAWQEANQLANLLGKAMPEQTFFAAASTQVAQENLNRPLSANGKVAVYVIKEGLQAAAQTQLGALENRAADAGIVAVVGHNASDYLAQLHQLANANAFAGKDVVLLTCFGEEIPGEVFNLLHAHGAVSVTGFRQPIGQQYLKPLLEALISQASAPSGERRKDYSISRALLRAIQELRKKQAGKTDPIDRLELIYERLGLHHVNRWAMAA